MKKVLYFTAGEKPTTDEANAIAALQARAVPTMEVVVRSAAHAADPGQLEPGDYLAGTRPTAYTAELYPAPPAGLGPVQGSALNVRNSAASKTVAGAVQASAGVLTSVDLPATAALLTNGQAVTVGGSTYTFTITNGVISGIVVS